MATTVTYKGQTIATVDNDTKTLTTAGTWVEGDISLTDTSVHPSGSTTYTQNGTYDVTALAQAVVDVSGGFSASDIMYGEAPYGVVTVEGTMASDYAFAYNGGTGRSTGITEFYAPNLLTIPINMFNNARKMQKAVFASATSVLSNAFQYCNSLADLQLPALQTANASYAFGSGIYTQLTLPSFIGVFGNDCFRGNTNIQTLDAGKPTDINARCFYGCSKLSALILRGTTMTVCGATTAFDNTPAQAGGTGMTVYVPSALISTYQQGSNWSTMYARGTMTFTAIEGSYYETHYADGTVIS